MSQPRTIRSFDYVNHPYDAVREILAVDAETVFRRATKAAALRASSVASALRVNLGGIEVSTDISIAVTDHAETVKGGVLPPATRLHLEWESTTAPRLFPLMRAELAVYPLTSTETQIDFSGSYAPPFGVLGKVVNAVVGHRIAEASVHRFIKDIAAHLRSELDDSPDR